MTSQIQPSSIRSDYPVAGQDNSTQGFRDNFGNIKQNFTYAYNEITELQANALMKNQANDLSNTTLINPSLQSITDIIYDFGTVSGIQSFDFKKGNYQKMTLGGSVVVDFTNISGTSGKHACMFVELLVPNVSYKITWPASVSKNLSTIAGASSQTVTFYDAGTYIFRLDTIDGGTSWSISEITRTRNTIQGNLRLQTTVSNAAATGILMTVSNVGGSVYGSIVTNSITVDLLNSSGTSLSISGNITCGNLIANTGIYGNIVTPIQSNITLLGTQTALSVSGNANVGNLTVNGITDICNVFQTSVQFVANALTGQTTQLYSNVAVAIIQPNAATIASHTITMPTTPITGQRISISFASNITSLTMSGVGQTVNGAYTTANSNVGGTWVYYGSTWYKIT
jgi:hypothetical protein